MIRRALAFAGPFSLVATVLLLYWNRAAFRHGPGVPTAGTEEAWAVMWLCLALVVIGHAISLPATLAWLVGRRRAHEPVEKLLCACLLYHLVIGGPLLWLIVGR